MEWTKMKVTRLRRSVSWVVVCMVLMLALGPAAWAQTKSKTRKSEGRLVALDAQAGTLTVKEKGRDVVYQVKLEGSVLTRTTSTMNARPVKLDEIPPTAPVIVYWRPDENDRKVRHARKVDAPKVDPEFLEDWD
jgi:hypothetical protein